MFAHFTYLYATSLERQERFAYAQLQHLSLCEIATVFCSAPDESKYCVVTHSAICS